MHSSLGKTSDGTHGVRKTALIAASAASRFTRQRCGVPPRNGKMLPRPFARPAADWKVLCAGGHDTPQIAEGHDVTESSEKFAALYQLLTKAQR